MRAVSRRSTVLALVASVALVSSVALVWPGQQAQAARQTLTVLSDVDTYVSSARPTATHGDLTWLASCPRSCGEDPDADRRLLVRFDVAQLPRDARNIRASLQLYALRPATGVMAARPVPGSFDEAGVTYATMPAAGDSVGHRTAVSAATYNAWDVSRYVTGNGSFALMVYSESGEEGLFASSDDRRNLGPRLSLTYDGGAGMPTIATSSPVGTLPTAADSIPSGSTPSGSTPSGSPKRTALSRIAPGTPAPAAAAGPLPIDLPARRPCVHRRARCSRTTSRRIRSRWTTSRPAPTTTPATTSTRG